VKRLALLAVVACACAVAASPAYATNECKGLQVCVPVAGPWVLAAPGQVEFQLACPKRFIVGGLDAEVSNRGIDVGFVGSLGSPVNPGITTSKEALFLGRLIRGSDPAPAFRPHIGCVPASGGGGRGQTAYQAFKPGKPAVRHVSQITALPGITRRAVRGCARGERLVEATHAIGFFGSAPPSVSLARAVHVTQQVQGGRVHLSIRGGFGLGNAHAVVQLDLLCVAL
jgi:hypothetical protein